MFQRNRETRYGYDKVFGPYSTQRQVYQETVSPLITTVLDGFNATVFAYGATGAGKTHTMIGNCESGPGVMLMALRDLFERISDLEERQMGSFQVRIAYLEVYNETLRDLLVSLPDDDPLAPSSSMEDDTDTTASRARTTSLTTAGRRRTSNTAAGRRALDIREEDATASEASGTGFG